MKRWILRFAVVIVWLGLLLEGPPAAWAQSSASVRSVRVNGIEMRYQDLGKGEPLLLLHGFGGCGNVWQPFLTVFAAHFRLIIPDLRGHGGSTNPANTFTHRQSAEDVFALLDHLAVRTVKAVGISTGGMTLLHMATRQPERVEAMVLVGATHYFPEPARAIMRSMDAGPPPEVLEYYKRCATRGEEQVQQITQQFRAFKDSYDDMNFTSPFLGTIKARTLIIHGDRDEFFPVNIPVEMYQSIPRSSLWIVPDGHHVPVSGGRAREFQDITVAFLQGKSIR